MPERIRSLGRSRLIHALEQETLVTAHGHLLQVRDRLALMGFTTDIVPENPDKLDRLAAASGVSDGNAWLAVHEDVMHSVRSIYEEGIERLRS
jgi:glutamine synthetase adenylyltransferase